MKKADVVDFFDNQIKVAKSLNLTKSSVSQWGDLIPEKQAMRLERITGGQLKYDPELYSKSEKHLSASKQ